MINETHFSRWLALVLALILLPAGYGDSRSEYSSPQEVIEAGQAVFPERTLSWIISQKDQTKDVVLLNPLRQFNHTESFQNVKNLEVVFRHELREALLEEKLEKKMFTMSFLFIDYFFRKTYLTEEDKALFYRLQNGMAALYFNQVPAYMPYPDVLWKLLDFRFAEGPDCTLFTKQSDENGSEKRAHFGTVLSKSLLSNGHYILPNRKFLEELYYFLERSSEITGSVDVLEVAAGNGVLARGIQAISQYRESERARAFSDSGQPRPVLLRYIASDKFCNSSVVLQKILGEDMNLNMSVLHESAAESLKKHKQARTYLMFNGGAFAADVFEHAMELDGPVLVISSARNYRDMKYFKNHELQDELSEKRFVSMHELPIISPLIYWNAPTRLFYMDDKDAPEAQIKARTQKIEDIIDGIWALKELSLTRGSLKQTEQNVEFVP